MTEPADQGTDDQGDQQSSSYTPPASQADLDRIIADRVARTKNQFKDYGDLKAKAAELDQIRQANQTEAERVTEALNKVQGDVQRWRDAAVKARIEALASSDYATPSDAVLLLGDASRFVGDDNVIDEDGIRQALAAELEKRPTWRKQDITRIPAPNLAQGSSANPVRGSASDQMNALLRGSRS